MSRKTKRPAAPMHAKTSMRKTSMGKASMGKASMGKTKPKTPRAAKRVRASKSRDKVRAYRERMRAKGLRLVQMWVPDTRTPEFAAEARRQSLLANTTPFAAEDQAWVDSMSDWNST